MLSLYAWNTPNGQKPIILLEELLVDYKLLSVNLSSEQNRSAEFLELNPNGKIPVLTHKTSELDVTIYESGAILQYLAETHGKYWGNNPIERVLVAKWVYWQVANLGPMIGQWGHFAMREEKIDYAINRYFDESVRLLKILDDHLKDREWIGSDYSIADIACYPWVKGGMQFMTNLAHKPIPTFLNIERWQKQLSERPAIVRAFAKSEALANT